jgi:hypothetical protein
MIKYHIDYEVIDIKPTNVIEAADYGFIQGPTVSIDGANGTVSCDGVVYTIEEWLKIHPEDSDIM